MATVEHFASTLPGGAYYDPARYAQEIARIFGEHWVCAGRAESVKRPGDFITVTIGDEHIVVVCGQDRTVRAFLNVCRHRGARICTDGAGSANVFQCRYHAWTYTLEGKLQGAPNIASFAGFDRDAHALVPVAIEMWQGLIWLNLSPMPGSLAEQVQPALHERFASVEQFERYGMSDLVTGKRITYDVAANWKLVVENFLECYHCAPMHPEFCALLPGFRVAVPPQGMVGTGTPFADDVEQFSLSGTGNRPRLPGLTEGEDRQYFGFIFPPNVLVSLLPDHVVVHTAHPRGPERTEVVCDWLFAPDVVADPAFDPGDTVAIFDLVNTQDWDVCELTQQGMRSRAYARGGTLVPAEHDLVSFHTLIQAWLGASGAEQ
jgi:glycine betaine catabolism A